MPIKKSDKTNFGSSFAELETIVQKLEHEEIDLEDGLKDFERALVLARLLKERLNGVENKVVEIKTKFKDVLGEEKSDQSSIQL